MTPQSLDRIRFAFVVAAALTTAYAIALSMGWSKPYWAGIGIATCSVATVGESLIKAWQRVAGTAVGMIIALMFIAYFAQERWQYGLTASLWLAFCCYRMQNNANFYFWQCCGFTAVILSVMTDYDSQTSFYTVMERARETILGVLCYVVFAILVARLPSRSEFRARLLEKLRLLGQRLAAVRRYAEADTRDARPFPRRAEIIDGSDTLPALRLAATFEDFDMREHRRGWSHFLRELSRLGVQVNHLNISLEAMAARGASLNAPQLADALTEFERRIDSIASIVTTSQDAPAPQATPDLEDDQAPQPQEDPFHAGELLRLRDMLDAIDSTTRELYLWALDIAEIRRHAAGPRPDDRPRSIIPDPETLLRCVTQTVMFWPAFLLYLYVPALPDGSVIVALAAMLSLMISHMPWMQPVKLVFPYALGITYGGIAHILIMPKFSGFVGLGAILFFGAFLLAYVFAPAQRQSFRFMGLVMFVMVLQVTNQQAYSAMFVFNLAAVVSVLIALLQCTLNLVVSWRPEAVLLRLFGRYAANFDGLIDRLSWDVPPRQKWWSRQLRAYNTVQLIRLPVEIAVWIDKLDKRAFADSERAALVELNDRLTILSDRAFDLARLRGQPANPHLVDLLNTEISDWKMELKRVAANLRSDGELFDTATLSDTFANRVSAITRRVETSLGADGSNVTQPQGLNHMQRMLSAYRDVSSALLSVAECVNTPNWGRLSETRF